MKSKVEFKISKKTVERDDGFSSMLDLAQKVGVDIETDCEQGLCGTYKVKLVSGEVDMENDDGLDEAELEQDMIPRCVSAPKTNVALEV